MKQELVVMTVKVDLEMLQAIENYTETVDAYSRSEALRDLIALGLRAAAEEESFADVLKTIKRNARDAAIQRLHILMRGATDAFAKQELTFEGEELLE